jgi:protein-S-isoprenylcysteine O-methyltransferase Ste14
MKHSVQYALRVLRRWVLILAMLAILLFSAAGTIRIASIQAYLAAYGAFLFVAMSAVDPRLARERVNPGRDAVAPHLRFMSGLFFLLTVATAAFAVGRLHIMAVPPQLRWFALLLFAMSSALQAWAMIRNSFFSPVLRIQNEHGHHLVESGPYRFVRHPGYLAMCFSIPASAVAIGSWLALIPASIFVAVILRRATTEDEFLRKHLAGYTQYASRVPGALVPRLYRCGAVPVSEYHHE